MGEEAGRGHVLAVCLRRAGQPEFGDQRPEPCVGSFDVGQPDDLREHVEWSNGDCHGGWARDGRRRGPRSDRG